MPFSICARQPDSSCAEGDGHRVHQVRAAGLDDAAELLLALAEHSGQMLQRRQQLLVQQQRRADVDRRRDHIVAALAHVDVIVRMHRLARARRQVRDHLVGVHVGAGAGAGLKHVDRELRVVAAVGHLRAAASMAAGERAGKQSESRVGRRGGLLDQRQRRDEAARHVQAADREVLDRALRLRAPQRVGRHLQLAHAVALDAE